MTIDVDDDQNVASSKIRLLAGQNSFFGNQRGQAPARAKGPPHPGRGRCRLGFGYSTLPCRHGARYHRLDALRLSFSKYPRRPVLGSIETG